METFKEYLIPVKGLDLGVHLYEFELTDKFFSQFDESPIGEAQLNVRVVLDKRETMMLWAFEVQGSIQTHCDRCMERIQLPIHQSHDLIVKYGEEGEKGEVVFIPSDTPDFQLAPYLYEFSCLSVPMVKVYDCENDENAPCNFEVLERLDRDAEEASGRGNSLGDQLEKLGLKPEK